MWDTFNLSSLSSVLSFHLECTSCVIPGLAERGTLYAIDTGIIDTGTGKPKEAWKRTPQPASSIVASVAVDRAGNIYLTSSYNHLDSQDVTAHGMFAVGTNTSCPARHRHAFHFLRPCVLS